MDYNKDFEEIKAFISDFEKRLSQKIFNNCICTIEFTKIIDYYYLTCSRNKNENIMAILPHYLRVWPNILSMCYDNFQIDGYPLYTSKNELEIFCHGIFIEYSKLDGVKKLLSMVNYNLLDLHKIGEKEYKFTANLKGYPIENEEVEDYFRYRDKKIKIMAYMEKEEDIHKIMNGLVYVFKDNFIGYTADTRVDDYYLLLGTCISEAYWGKHDFPEDARFGGVEYVHYVASVVIFIGITLKHLDFCDLLIKKQPHIQLIDIINVFHTINEEVETLVTALHIPKDKAEIIMDVLSYNREDLSDCINTYNKSFPMFLKVANNMLLRSNLAFLTDPFMYLLRQLNIRFPKDWSREINKREQIFRTQLYDIIIDTDDFIKIDKNINIYENKRRVTDIDALVIDKRTKTMSIFQLKWQEPFGESMSERNSKMNNFITASNKWIKDVSDWIESSTIQEKAGTFGIKKAILSGEWTYKFFVLGRHFSHFSKCNNNDKNAAWCNWYKLNEICATMEKYTYNNYFEELYSRIKDAYKKVESKEVKIDNDCIKLEGYKFIINNS